MIWYIILKRNKVLTLTLAAFYQANMINTLYYNNYEHYNNGQLFAFQHLEIRSNDITKVMPTIHNYTFLKSFLVVISNRSTFNSY